ncbi:MAG TPA: Gfo/Idh/MocA family oxidoreductase [Acidimicrobiales bacterium]|nr:Gfo/Idh/MocA family oxidoreductase [Acidimicrobiales bacterium]
MPDARPAVRRVAVVGLGVGRAHLWAWKRLPDDFRVAAVCDHDADRRAATGERFPDAAVAADLDEVLARPDVDVVDLCTPPALHLEQITAVLRAGKDVVCEKPVVGTVGEVDQLLAVEAKTGHRVMPIFQYRYGHGLQKLRHLVDAGATGPLHTATVEVSWLRGPAYYSAPWRGTVAGELGGVLLTHAVHALDMLTYVAGPVVAVSARTAIRVNDVETEDCAAATLELDGGALATLSATLGSLVEITRHRLCFARLTAESGTDPYTNSSDPWAFTGAGFDVAEALRGFVPRAENFLGQFERYAEALRVPGAELPVTLHDARRAIAAVAAMYESAAGRREVRL